MGLDCINTAAGQIIFGPNLCPLELFCARCYYLRWHDDCASQFMIYQGTYMEKLCILDMAFL